MAHPQRLPSIPGALAGVLAQNFLSDELPESLRPTPASHRLQVAVIWGDNRVVEVCEVPPGKPFTIGPRNASLEMFQTLPSYGPLPLVQWQPDGSALLLLPEAAKPVIRKNQMDYSTRELLDQGRAERVDVPIRGIRTALALDERATVQFGTLQLVARFTRPEGMARRPLADRIDHAFLAALGGVLVLAAILLVVLRLAHFQDVFTDADLQKLADQNKQFLVVRAVPPPHPPGGARAAKKEGRAGRPKAPAHEAARHRLLGKDPGNHQLVDHIGLVGAIDALPWHPGGSNEGLTQALNGLKANGPIADANGTLGLGVRGGDKGGGGHSLGIGNIGERGRGPGGPGHGFGLSELHKPQMMPPRVDHVPADDPGYKDVIARVMRRHWNEIKYCYEKELNHSPDLEGKVAVRFEIGAGGRVLSARVGETTLNNAAAESCILRTIQQISFPPPKSSLVDVNYPFVFAVAQ